MRGRFAPTSAMWSPRLRPCSASPQARKRASSANCFQVQVCQMPRSFSRIAGRSPRAWAWCTSSFGNVSSVPMSIAIEFLLLRPADSCTKSAVYDARFSTWKDCVADERQGALDQERRRQAFPLAKISGGLIARNDSVRARLVDGLTADLRPRSAGAAAFVGDGMVRRARLRHLDPGQRGLWSFRQEPPDQLRYLERRG